MFSKLQAELAARSLSKFTGSIKETARSYEEWQRDQETVARIKEGITHQLEQGNAPQYILYGAIQAIGILTRDKEWAEAGQQALNAVYEDLAQESLLVNNAAVAAHRLEEMKTAYNEKLRRQLERNIKGYGKIEKARVLSCLEKGKVREVEC